LRLQIWTLDLFLEFIPEAASLLPEFMIFFLAEAIPSKTSRLDP